MESSDKSILVHDLSGFDYELREELGQGGQGKVWTTNIPNVAIKTLMKEKNLEQDLDTNPEQDPDINSEQDPKTNIERDPNEILLYQYKMQRLKQLPLHGLNQFSLPIAILQDACGYVMRNMSDTSTLLKLMPNRFTSKLIQDLNITLPFWLQSQMDALQQRDEQLARASEEPLKRLALYAQRGGVRLRWLLVYEIADILSLLHARGLVFGDLSVGNILVSKRRYSVWFIDVDNICFQGEGSVVFTPGCCAPEIFNQLNGVNQQSDIYAFALLAFELLTMRHPFHSGRLVEEAVALANQQEEAANRGAIPWILDSEDRSNALAQEDELLQYTLTHNVLALFQQTFGLGRNEPSQRPQLWMFKQAIKQARYRSIVCPHCMMGFTYGENTIENGVCPFCGSKLPLVLVMSFKQQVLWAHELVSQDMTSDSPYPHFEFLNRLNIPLELLNPLSSHKSQQMPQTDLLFNSKEDFTDFTNSASAAVQGNTLVQDNTVVQKGSATGYQLDALESSQSQSAQAQNSKDLSVNYQFDGQLLGQDATVESGGELSKVSGKNARNTQKHHKFSLFETVRLSDLLQAQEWEDDDDLLTKPEDSINDDEQLENDKNDESLVASLTQHGHNKASANQSQQVHDVQNNVNAESAEKIQNTHTRVNTEPSEKIQGTHTAALHDINTSAKPFNKAGVKHGSLDVSVASMKWHQNKLYIYPEADFEQVLEYALVPPEVVLKQSKHKVKPQYAVCPYGLEISLQQLSYGICLRLSGCRQVFLRCVSL